MILEGRSKNVQKQEIRNLVGLKPQSLHVWLKIVKRQDGSVQFYNPLVPSGTEIQSWVAIQTTKLVVPSTCPPTFEKRA